MNEFFEDLLEYNRHSNEKLIIRFQEETQEIPEKSLLLLSHLINAQHIWNQRILGQTPFLDVWEEHHPDALHTLNEENYKTSRLILDATEWDEEVIYVNSKGNRFQNTVRDIMFHLINHATYHRGQIASDMKQNGLKPLVTDYIFYKR